jgi:hypothetical protein
MLGPHRHLDHHRIRVFHQAQPEVGGVRVGGDHLAEPGAVHRLDATAALAASTVYAHLVNHPLLDALLAAAAGSFPPVDGCVTHLPPLENGVEAIVSFTGHAFLASRLSADDIADLAPDGFGSVLHPSVLLRMAGERGDIAVGVIDVTLVAPGYRRRRSGERDDGRDAGTQRPRRAPAGPTRPIAAQRRRGVRRRVRSGDHRPRAGRTPRDEHRTVRHVEESRRGSTPDRVHAGDRG